MKVMKMKQTLVFWTQGVRMYVGVAIGLITLEVFWWSQVSFSEPRLATIRLQEVYAWLSLAVLLTTILIGPAISIFPHIAGKQQLRDARRLLGIGAAWFAVLHASISYLIQFRGSNLAGLPRSYQQALALGAIGIIVLLILVFTSFNAVMKLWGVWWFRVHRLVYIGILAALMHAFMIGTHASGLLALLMIAGAATVWVSANIYLLMTRSAQTTTWKIISLSYGAILLLAVLNYGLTQHAGYNVITTGHMRQGHQ